METLQTRWLSMNILGLNIPLVELIVLVNIGILVFLLWLTRKLSVPSAHKIAKHLKSLGAEVEDSEEDSEEPDDYVAKDDETEEIDEEPEKDLDTEEKE